MVQISGESFLKHSRIAFNFSSGPCAPCQTGPSQTMRIGCSDTYSTGFNGNRFNLGPTTEIDPWLGTWNPFGSYFDVGDPAVTGAAATDGLQSLTSTQVAAFDAETLTDADRWILGRLDEVLAEIDAGFESYEFSKACEALYHFAWDEVCDWYLELAKVQFAENDEKRSEATALVLGAVLEPLLRALSPVMPFVTEVLWKALTGGESLVVAPWPTTSGRDWSSDSAARVDDLQRLITEVRRFRSDQGLRPGQRVAVQFD